MEMRRYVRHSPAWWIVGSILALLTAGCIVLGLLAQRDSAAAEAVPIGDDIYLGDYNYIDVQYMTTWAYRVTLGDGRKLVFYLAEDTEGYGYLVQLNDAEYARSRTLWTIPMLTTAVTAQCRTIRPRPRSWPSISR